MLKERPYWWDTTSNPSGFEPSSEKSKRNTEQFEVLGSDAPLSASRRFDVAVVGAGYTGLAAARQLARSGASVVVLERQRVGWGASSRNGGQVLTGLRPDPATLVAHFGQSSARELFEASLLSITALESLIADEAIACDYGRTGHIQAAWKPAHYDAFREEQELLARVFEYRVAVVPRADQHVEIGSDRYHGLIVDERSAALNPAKYVLGLAAAAARAGAVIAERVGVERLTRAASRWKVDTTCGAVDADDVVVATNGYTDAVMPALQRRFVPLGSYIVVTEPLTEATAARLLPKGRMAFDSKHFLYYFRLTDDRRLLFGGRAEFGLPTADATRRAAAILGRGFREVFPELAGTPVEYAWGGNVAFTRDQLPHAGRLNEAYYAGGYSGHGIALATSLGGLIARRVAGETFDHPLLDRPLPAIPLYRGRPWFLPLVGAYYRLSDWIA